MYFSSIDPSSRRPRSLICTFRRPRVSGGVCSNECTEAMLHDSWPCSDSHFSDSRSPWLRSGARPEHRGRRSRPCSALPRRPYATCQGTGLAVVVDEPALLGVAVVEAADELLALGHLALEDAAHVALVPDDVRREEEQ